MSIFLVYQDIMNKSLRVLTVLSGECCISYQ